MRRRTLLVLILAVALCAGSGLTIALTTSGDSNHGLSRQKVAELTDYGITPQQYVKAQQRAEAHKAALQVAPPPDPNVAGPSLIKAEHESELFAWKVHYSRQLHIPVREHWHINQLAETHTIVILQLVPESGGRPLVSAEWVIKFALDRPPTPAEEKIFHSADGVEPLNAAARSLEMFPKPQVGARLPIAILAAETLSPGRHEVIVRIQPAERYEPTYIVRHGLVDEPLLRGKALAASPPNQDLILRLANTVRIYEQALGTGRAGPKRRSSIYRLNHAFNEGPVLLTLGWHSSARNLKELLRRPVQELTIFP